MTFEMFIPPRSKTVLELTGKAAEDFQTSKEEFLTIQPDCEYTIAKDLWELDDRFAADVKFDSILVQSALIGKLEGEELVELLKKIGDKLNTRGVLIFALENIAFAENLMAILENKPPVFKVTLTRFELEDAVKESGLNLARSLKASRRVPVKRGIAESASEDVDISAFTHIITAMRDELPPKTVIQTVIGESIVCAPVRIHMPNSFFTTEPNITTLSTELGKEYSLFSDEMYARKIFINQRMNFDRFFIGLQKFNEMKQNNYLYLAEMDDHPVLWEKDYEKTGWINFVGVHAIQTSTKYLADFLGEYNPHVKIFPNHLAHILPLRDFNEEFKKPDKPVTIFFGAINRDKDFEEILPIVNQFAAEYGDKLEFKVIARQKLFNSIESEHKTLLGKPDFYDGQFIAHDDYEEGMRTSDIALLPLMDNKFNRSKSDLKFVECAACGAVALASPVVYSDVITEGETGFIYHDLREFAEKLRLLIDNRDKRREVATAAYNYVRHNRLFSQHYQERLDWYFELLQKLPELNAETEKRIEKIAPKFKDEKPLPPPENPAPGAGNSESVAEIIIPV